MKIFKKVLPVLMAAMLVLPTVSSPLVVMAAEKSWEVGKNDPTEVVATYNSSTKTLTFTNQYEFDESSGAEELPNPGLMMDSALSEIKDYFTTNDITDVKVVIGSGVKSVGANALSSCDAITNVEVTSSVFEKFGEGAFSGCSELTSVSMPYGKEIGRQAFANCPKLATVTLSESLKTIGAAAFTGDSALTSLDIPSSVTTISDEAFSNTGITAITGGENVTSVGTSAFSGASTINLATEASTALKNYDWTNAGYTDISLAGTKQAVITFVTNGADAIAPVTIEAGTEYTAPTPTYSGMTFDGWFTNSALTKSFADGTVVDSNITLYAKWHGEYITVTFESNNGVASTTQQVTYGGKATKPTDPTPSGDQVFAGWYSDSALTSVFSFDTALKQDTTLYAKWSDATYYTVTFNTDGGSDVDSQSVKSGSLATKPTDPTKTDYTFDNWYKDSEFKTKWNFDKDTITKDTTIYAKFLSNKVTVKFDTGGGSTISSVTVDRNGKLTKPSDPTKDNCEFLGWYTSDSYETEFIFDSDTVSDNMTLYAKWNQTAYTVKWESNGGSAVDPVTANPNALIAKPTDPIKDGYYLVGWCKDSDLTTQWNFDSDKVTADITLYALWAVGDPATVDGSTPGVTNTGAKAPQTGDSSNPLFHLFAGLTAAMGSLGASGAVYTKRKTRLI